MISIEDITFVSKPSTVLRDCLKEYVDSGQTEIDHNEYLAENARTWSYLADRVVGNE